MPYVRLLLRYTGLLATLLATAGCTYQAAVQRLSPPEQVEFRTYSKVITSAQARTYLAKATPVERTAYLRDLGLVQRFQALAPLDREAILAGYPSRGMSAEALRFLWGPPYYTEGRANYYEHWYYLGSSLALAVSGNDYHTFGNRVVVYLDGGRVTAWLDFVPTTDDAGSNDDWNQ
jgi:hypothetical protein